MLHLPESIRWHRPDALISRPKHLPQRRGFRPAITRDTPAAQQKLAQLLPGLMMLLATVASANPPIDPPPLGLPPLAALSANPQTPAKIRLGEQLYRDARFSSTGEISCQSCHLDAIAFHDGRPVPKGVHMARGTRNAPSVINAAYASTLFWDGRAASLEEQALQPLTNPVEHGLENLDQALEVIRDDPDYVAQFAQVFELGIGEITMEQFAQAVAAFERTLLFANSAFDRWYYGGESGALSAAEERGFQVFTGPGRCAECHTLNADYALFSDDSFHNVNVGFYRLPAETRQGNPEAIPDGILDHVVLSDLQKSELGRYAVTGNIADLGAFRTPSLRNVARTAPYLHDGSLSSLEQVVQFFNNGGKHRPDDPGPNPYQSPRIEPLHLSRQQQADLVAFLKSLTSPEFSQWYR